MQLSNTQPDTRIGIKLKKCSEQGGMSQICLKKFIIFASFFAKTA